MNQGDYIEIKKEITESELYYFRGDKDLLIRATYQEITNEIIKELTKYIVLEHRSEPDTCSLYFKGKFDLNYKFTEQENTIKQLEFDLDTLEERNTQLTQAVDVLHAECGTYVEIIESLQDNEKTLFSLIDIKNSELKDYSSLIIKLSYGSLFILFLGLIIFFILNS